MANPRNVVSFEEIGIQYRTYKIDNSTITHDITKQYGSAQAGVRNAVKLSAAGTVALTTDASDVVGRLEKVEGDNKATVAVAGCLSLKGGSGATVTHGAKIVGDLDSATAGFIRAAASAVAAELLVARGQIIDSTVLNEVWVELGA